MADDSQNTSQFYWAVLSFFLLYQASAVAGEKGRLILLPEKHTNLVALSNSSSIARRSAASNCMLALEGLAFEADEKEKQRFGDRFKLRVSDLSLVHGIEDRFEGAIGSSVDLYLKIIRFLPPIRNLAVKVFLDEARFNPVLRHAWGRMRAHCPAELQGMAERMSEIIGETDNAKADVAIKKFVAEIDSLEQKRTLLRLTMRTLQELADLVNEEPYREKQEIFPHLAQDIAEVIELDAGAFDAGLRLMIDGRNPSMTRNLLSVYGLSAGRDVYAPIGRSHTDPILDGIKQANPEIPLLVRKPVNQMIREILHIRR